MNVECTDCTNNLCDSCIYNDDIKIPEKEMTMAEAAEILEMESESWDNNPNLIVDPRLRKAMDIAIKVLKTCDMSVLDMRNATAEEIKSTFGYIKSISMLDNILEVIADDE